MAKAEWGLKRTCPDTGKRFYNSKKSGGGVFFMGSMPTSTSAFTPERRAGHGGAGGQASRELN